MNFTAADNEVDARGTLCPEPLLRLRLALNDMARGQTVRLLATDPHAQLDLEVFCATTAHELVACREAAEASWEFLLRKG